LSAFARLFLHPFKVDSRPPPYLAGHARCRSPCGNQYIATLICRATKCGRSSSISINCHDWPCEYVNDVSPVSSPHAGVLLAGGERESTGVSLRTICSYQANMSVLAIQLSLFVNRASFSDFFSLWSRRGTQLTFILPAPSLTYFQPSWLAFERDMKNFHVPLRLRPPPFLFPPCLKLPFPALEARSRDWSVTCLLFVLLLQDGSLLLLFYAENLFLRSPTSSYSSDSSLVIKVILSRSPCAFSLPLSFWRWTPWY